MVVAVWSQVSTGRAYGVRPRRVENAPSIFHLLTVVEKTLKIGFDAVHMKEAYFW